MAWAVEGSGVGGAGGAGTEPVGVRFSRSGHGDSEHASPTPT